MVYLSHSSDVDESNVHGIPFLKITCHDHRIFSKSVTYNDSKIIINGTFYDALIIAFTLRIVLSEKSDRGLLYKSERTITEKSRKNWRRSVGGKTRQGRSANRGVLWTRLTARAGHSRVVGCKRGTGGEEGTQCHPKIEGEKEGGCENESIRAR